MPYDPANPTNTAAALRQTDRKRLLGQLVKLGDADPEQRAKAALAATELLRRKGLDWSALVPVDRAESVTVDPPPNWQRRALAMSVHPSVTPDESTFLNQISGWRVPGLKGLARLEEIAERIGVELR